MTYFDSDWKSAVYLTRCSEVSADSDSAVLFSYKENMLLLLFHIPINLFNVKKNISHNEKIQLLLCYAKMSILSRNSNWK